ncbi:hypothetical protein NET02_02580 [Thermomicrobiaceae bacterium CFH 74404]|uniref:Uncharacterized protein n=1 Tax=Thermalbibacter longus TaxID=2951981 RepID=A0AA41WEM7_9BACT|nr:hypothetical protein [Thermalbibacter longus]MCM8748026.1 hypothetical protein [Thermalbibacter longus]
MSRFVHRRSVLASEHANSTRRRAGPPRGTALWLLVVLTLLLVACGRGSPEPAPSPSPDTGTPTRVAEARPSPVSAGTPAPTPALTPTPMPAGPPDEAVLALNELLDEEGRLPLETALEIFAAHVGPLPGVTPRPLPGDNAGRVAEAAIVVVAAQRESLPPEVAAAVEDALFGRVDEWVEIPPSGQGTAQPGARATLVDRFVPGARAAGPLDELRQVIEEVRGRIEARAGVRLTVPVRLGVVRRMSTRDIQAYATPVESGGRMTACRIVFRADVADEPTTREYVAAHELWHCFQFQHTLRSHGAWVEEGQAEWVASVIASDPSPAASFWDTWLATPPESLWRRSYDAIGLYAAAEAAGHDPFPVMLRMFDLGNRDAVSALFGGMAFEEALRLVAQTLVRAPAYGLEWESTGLGITYTRATELVGVSPPGQRIEVDAGPFGSLPLELTIGESGEHEAVRIRVYDAVTAGAVEFEDGTVFDLRGAESLLFCLPGSVCTCEDGSPPGGQELPPLPASRAVLTVASPVGGTIGFEVEYAAIKDLCNRLVGVWMASARDILAANTAPYGGLPADYPCEGTVTLTFAEDGTFRHSSELHCTFGESSGSGVVYSEGRYEVRGDSVAFLDVQTTGSLTVDGIDLGAMVQYLTPRGEARYQIEGDRLTIGFTMPDGAAVENHFTRSR